MRQPPLLLTSLVAAMAFALACGTSPSRSPDADAGSAEDAGAAPLDAGSAADAGRADASDAGPADGGSAAPPLRTVFLIVMENHSWSDLRDNPSAPYLNKTLLPLGAHAEQYFTPPGLHPSEPNYLWLEAGTSFGITDDLDPARNHQSTTDHLVTQLETAGISWKAYTEGIGAGTCPTTASGLYAPKHTPMVFFDDVTRDPAYCSAHVVPLTRLGGDLNGGAVARYNFITPDLCHDMHGSPRGSTACPAASTDLIKLGDDFLRAQLPPLLASAAYQSGGVIFIVWDEGTESAGGASDGPLPLIVLSAKARPRYAGNLPYTHSAMLRSLETIFGVPFLRGAATSRDLGDLFTSFP